MIHGPGDQLSPEEMVRADWVWAAWLLIAGVRMFEGSNNTDTAHCRGSVSPGRHHHILIIHQGMVFLMEMPPEVPYGPEFGVSRSRGSCKEGRMAEP